MKKHYFLPNNHSYFNGENNIIDWKCKYCNKIVKNRPNNYLRKSAYCKKSQNKSTFSELFNKKYDCTVFNDNLYHKWCKFKSYIKFELFYIKYTFTKKIKKMKLNMYIFWHILFYS